MPEAGLGAVGCMARGVERGSPVRNYRKHTSAASANLKKCRRPDSGPEVALPGFALAGNGRVGCMARGIGNGSPVRHRGTHTSTALELDRINRINRISAASTPQPRQ